MKNSLNKNFNHICSYIIWKLTEEKANLKNKILTSPTSDKGIIYKIYKELKQLDNKKTIEPIKNQQRAWTKLDIHLQKNELLYHGILKINSNGLNVLPKTVRLLEENKDDNFMTYYFGQWFFWGVWPPKYRKQNEKYSKEFVSKCDG
jgi:hypothetical protein